MKKATKIIAVAGKGGVGKTTVSALFVRYLSKQKGSSILAVDADPNSNLGDYLGFKPTQDIGKIVDETAKNFDKIPPSMSKDEYISYQIETSLGEAQGFDLLTMGRPEGSGCYCYANNILRNSISKLMSNYDFVVIDNEAGMEHLSRKTVKKIDMLLLVSDNSTPGLKAVKRIYDLVRELGIEYKQAYIIVNKVKSSKIPKIDLPVKLACCIPEEDKLLSYTDAGLMKIDDNNKIMKNLDEMFSVILGRSEPCLKN